MKNDIQEHYDSIQIKKAMQDLHITKASELKEYNCVTLAKFNSHPRFTFCKRVSHFESDLQILYPTFHFCNDFPVFSLAFMI